MNNNDINIEIEKLFSKIMDIKAKRNINYIKYIKENDELEKEEKELYEQISKLEDLKLAMLKKI